MQRKPVPPAPDALAAVDAVREAVPLVPKPEDDCCRRVTERADVPDRGEASEWLVFLSALGLLAEDDAGYARTQVARGDADLAGAFTANVFLAEECVAALGESPRSPADVFERVRDRIPRWERSKRDNWAEFWTGRVERRLDWAVLLGLATRENGGYVA